MTGASTADVDQQKQAFLDAFPEQGVIGPCARSLGLTPSTVRNWVRHDPQFAEAFEEARDEAADRLEAEANRRATGYISQRMTKDGEVIETITHSDQLLIFLLKGRRPDVFKERVANELSGPEGKPIETNDPLVSARLAAMLDEARRRRDNDLNDTDPFS